jgi:hypothetical protein
MLKPTQVVFGFLLFISIIAGGVMLFPFEQSDVPASPIESPNDHPTQTPNDQTKLQQSITDATQKIISRLEAIERLLKPDNNSPSSTKNIQTIADKLSTIETLLKPDNNAPPTAKNVREIVDRLSTIEALLKPPENPPPSLQISSNGSSSATFTYGMKFILALIVLTVTSGFASIVFLLQNNMQKVRAAGSLFALSGLTLFAFTVRIDKFVNLELSIPQQPGSVSIPAEQSITIHLPEIQTARIGLDCGDQSHSFRIGPFPDGLAAREDMKGATPEQVQAKFGPLDNQIEQVFDKLVPSTAANQDIKDQLITVLLIGSADKRSVVSTKEAYASNEGLAQARAIWVLRELRNLETQKNNTFLKTIPIITLNSGPSLYPPLYHVKAGDAAALLALDRAVQVCALWEKKL